MTLICQERIIITIYTMLNTKFIIAVCLIFFTGLSVINYSYKVIADILLMERTMIEQRNLPSLEKPSEIFAKGLYLTAYSANSKDKRREIIELLKQTELNAVVIDIKDYSGYILYDSRIKEVHDLKADKPILFDLQRIISDFKEAGIYVIARQTVFQDPVLAHARPEWAITSSHGGLWRDYKGLAWVDPTRREVWEYNLAIAKEASSLGFDEINFDYVRFPSDGNISTATYANLAATKEATMHSFFQYLSRELRNRPVYTSVDLFGLTLESHDFDLNIGQTLAAAVNTVDYIYPMTYPSHYPSGYMGFDNPAEHPYAVVNNGLTKAESVMEGSHTKLRPWLQAFDLGAVYDGAKIRDEIQAAEENANVKGWMIWNASNRYTSLGLLTENQ